MKYMYGIKFFLTCNYFPLGISLGGYIPIYFHRSIYLEMDERGDAPTLFDTNETNVDFLV